MTLKDLLTNMEATKKEIIEGTLNTELSTILLLLGFFFLILFGVYLNMKWKEAKLPEEYKEK